MKRQNMIQKNKDIVTNEQAQKTQQKEQTHMTWHDIVKETNKKVLKSNYVVKKRIWITEEILNMMEMRQKIKNRKVKDIRT